MSIRHLLDRRAARSTRSLSGTIFRGLLLFVVGVTAAFALVLAMTGAAAVVLLISLLSSMTALTPG